MSLVTLLVVLVLIGLITWLVTTYIPMDPGVKRVIQIAAVVVAVLYLLSAIGLFGSLSSIRVPRLD